MFNSILRSEKVRAIFVLFIISLAIRLFFLAVLTSNHAVETGRDAQGYFNRAIGFESILRAMLTGHLPATVDLARAYTSNWPPVHSFILGVGFLFFGNSMFAARLIMVILSAVTTPLVYLVTEKLSNQRAALFAAAIFAIYPSFVHFSFRLFSETTFLLLLFLMFYALLLTPQAKSMRRAVILATVTGVGLGMATLTRAIGLVWIPVIGLWAAIQTLTVSFVANTFGNQRNFSSPDIHQAKKPLGSRPVTIAAIICLATIVTLLPWELTMFGIEGRVILVTRTADLSLYLGNIFKPQPPLLAGKIILPQQSDQKNAIPNTGKKPSVQNIVNLPKPMQQWARTLTPDFTLYRFLLMLGYPPLDPWIVGSIFWLTLISFGLFLILAIWGMLMPTPALQHRWLIAGLIAVTMALYMFTHGQSRYSVPLLALLLPAAGHGLANLKALFAKTNRRWAIAAVGVTILLGASTYIGLPHEYSTVAASSYYVSFVRDIDALLRQKSTVSDRLLFRAVGSRFPQKLTVSIDGKGYTFADSTSSQLEWNPSSSNSKLDVVTQSRFAIEPLKLRLDTDAQSSAVITLTPSAWHMWQPSGVQGIEYLWLGSGAYREADLNSEATRF